ncbi:MAG TPA: BatA domain-containing protein [Myxococcaceae bacterium]|nr:BatA domain-containing protein [Myxococcaceae bacterium]
MIFGAPWMLLGALAALIPLAIHLFDRRRPRPVPFGAISFVLRSQRRTASRLKLRRLILYALRTLILLAIPVALSRPEWSRAAQAAALTRGPAATAVILDASLSMRWADGQSLFERGRELAREALRDLRPEEPATVLVCTQNAALPGAPIFDRGRLRSMIDDAQPTFLAADLNRCLDLAARSLEESPMAGKRLVVVSDLTTSSLRLEAPPPAVKGPDGQQVRPEIVLRDAAGGRAALPNHGIIDLKIEPALQAGPRTYQFTITIGNFSPEPAKDVEAALRIGDRVMTKGFVDVPARGTAQKVLTWRFEDGGAYSGEVQLTPDALAEDDRRAFVLQVPRELKALVVNGAPNSVRYRDEAFFVDAALGAQGSPVRESLRDTTAAWREDFSAYDLVYLLNVSAPPEDVAQQLRRFVEDGGGLFASMGDHVDPDAWNARLGSLLPRPLRLVKTAAVPNEEGAEARAAKLGQIALEHPIFSPFTGSAGEGLVSARFYKYMLLETEAQGDPDNPSQVLATYDDGAPAFAVARRGKGRVVLFTSTVDRDWADLAIRTSFLPLIQRTSSFLTGSLDERESMRVRVGTSVRLRREGASGISEVTSPSGASLPLKPQEDGAVLVGPVTEPGVHSVTAANGQAVPDLAFAAVLDPAESDLTRLDARALEAWFGEATVTRDNGTGADAPRVPLWTWLIATAAVAFFFEGVLLRK